MAVAVHGGGHIGLNLMFLSYKGLCAAYRLEHLP
jgi:hypothetical protein